MSLLLSLILPLLPVSSFCFLSSSFSRYSSPSFYPATSSVLQLRHLIFLRPFFLFRLVLLLLPLLLPALTPPLPHLPPLLFLLFLLFPPPPRPLPCLFPFLTP